MNSNTGQTECVSVKPREFKGELVGVDSAPDGAHVIKLLIRGEIPIPGEMVRIAAFQDEHD